ncbi:MAG: GAF domain-containing protein, partial [Fimbriimonadaceae bacterium]|nr:GAF domain-containing protein [Fimbriimonadaceae bacterium]
MIEFALRLIVAIGLTGAALTGRGLAWSEAWQASALLAAGSLMVFLLERRGLRTAAVSGFVAVADSAWIGFVLASAGRAEGWLWLAAAPVMAAVSRQAAPAVWTAPISAGALTAAVNLAGGSLPGPAGWVQIAAVAASGWLAAPGRVVHRLDSEAQEPEEPVHVDPEFAAEYFELRDSFRSLKDHASGLERRARRDRTRLTLLGALTENGGEPAQELARRLQSVADCAGLLLFSVNETRGRLVVRSFSGEVPGALTCEGFAIPSRDQERMVRHRIDKLLTTIRQEGRGPATASCILKSRGRILGLACLFDSTNERVLAAAERLDDAGTEAGAVLQMILEQEAQARRLQETELLYAVAGASAGAQTARDLCARVHREICEMLDLDSAAIALFQAGEPVKTAGDASSLELVEEMSFASGPGAAGWASTGGMEVWMPDARQDARLDSKIAVQRRTGSAAILPIRSGETVDGLLVVEGRRIGAVDESAMDSLRLVAGELAQALVRIDRTEAAEGLATPQEFFAALQATTQGCLVYLEVLHRDELIERHGRALVGAAISRMARRLRARLPKGCLL